jgi:hypothetical protein
MLGNSGSSPDQPRNYIAAKRRSGAHFLSADFASRFVERADFAEKVAKMSGQIEAGRAGRAPFAVIPGRAFARARNPFQRMEFWIPGPPLRGVPE